MLIRKRHLLILFIISILFILSCKKDETGISSKEETVLDTGTTLRDIDFINDTLAFICCGVPGESGAIWRSTDGGNHWIKIFDEPGRCIYDADFLDADNGFAVGDKLLMLRTTDGGNSWVNIYENYSFDTWKNFIRPIRKIKYLNQYTIIAVGGDTYYMGLMCRSYNWGQDWGFSNYNNQFNDIIMHDNRHIWICGYGFIATSKDSCLTLQTADYREDNFTAMDFADDNLGIVCGYNGGIYRTTDGGITWSERVKSNGTFGNRRHFNKICFADAGTAFAVGNSGLMVISKDGGASWTTIKTDIECDLYSLYAKNANEVFVGGSNGTLYHMHF